MYETLGSLLEDAISGNQGQIENSCVVLLENETSPTCFSIESLGNRGGVILQFLEKGGGYGEEVATSEGFDFTGLQACQERRTIWRRSVETHIAE
jgi:hypothetical protein